MNLNEFVKRADRYGSHRNILVKDKMVTRSERLKRGDCNAVEAEVGDCWFTGSANKTLIDNSVIIHLLVNHLKVSSTSLSLKNNKVYFEIIYGKNMG